MNLFKNIDMVHISINKFLGSVKKFVELFIFLRTLLIEQYIHYYIILYYIT